MTSSTDDSRAANSSPRGTSNGTRASASVRFARTMRCAMVGFGDENARAISSVCQSAQQSQRECHARFGRTEPGDNAMKTSRSRSSPTDRRWRLRSASPCGLASISSRRLLVFVSPRARPWRSLSIARCLAVAMSQAPGLSGTPDSGHRSSADDQRVLREVFGHADIAHDARQAGDDLRRLDAPHGFDGAMCGRARHARGATRDVSRSFAPARRSASPSPAARA